MAVNAATASTPVELVERVYAPPAGPRRAGRASSSGAR